MADLDALDPAQLAGLRAAYWRRVTGMAGSVEGRTFVDMNPFNGIKLPVIARLFADSCVVPGSGTPPVLRNRTSASRRDHTLEVLAVVHQLVDLDGSAGDLRLTPAVQVLP